MENSDKKFTDFVKLYPSGDLKYVGTSSFRS